MTDGILNGNGNSTGSKRLYVAVIALVVTLIGLTTSTMWTLASDRQSVAVSLEHLSVAYTETQDDMADAKQDINNIKDTLRLLAEQNAQILVLQSQVEDFRRRVDRLEAGR